VKFKIPFLGRAHKYTDEELELIKEISSNAVPLTQGKYLKEFEQKFADYIEVKYAFGVNNATNALEMTAQLCQFKEGDEIIAPAHTFTASVYPFLKKGAKVVWADIDFDNRVVSLDTIKKCVTKKTKAIVVVHLYGMIIPDIEDIANFCKENDIILIEDTAQALGTEINGKKAGSFGDFGVFSFHSHKNITTLGEGGMLVCNDERYAKIIPMLRHNGHCAWDFDREYYWQPAMGNVELPELDGEYLLPNNYCMGEVEAALGSKLLDRIDKINEEKRKRAIKFIDEITKVSDILEFNKISDKRHNYHLLVAYAKTKRDDIMKKLAFEKGIQVIVQYYPLYRYDLYKKLGYGQANVPNTDKFYDNMISFPFHHMMSDKEFDYMLKSTKEVLEEIESEK